MLTHKGTKEIHTNRLLLRKYRLSDTEQMFENYASDDRVTKYLSWKAYSKPSDIIPFLEMSIKDYEKSSTYHWAIEYEGKMIGSISVMSVDDLRNNCEVGKHRIMAKHDIENKASGEVMKKCKMSYEGRLKEYYLRHDGTYSDALVYGIVNENN